MNEALRSQAWVLFSFLDWVGGGSALFCLSNSGSAAGDWGHAVRFHLKQYIDFAKVGSGPGSERGLAKSPVKPCR